jgi:tetratricopeptide (TPR) repeat protein
MSKIISSSKIQRLLKESSLYCNVGKLTEARNIYQDLLKIVPSHPDVLGNLGTIELQFGNTELGVNYLKQSISTNPNQHIFLTNLGNGLIDLDKSEEAIYYFDIALKIAPRSSNILCSKARALKSLKKYNESIDAYKDAIDVDPKNYHIYMDLAFLYNILEKFDLSIDYYNRAIKIEPNNPGLFYNRGIVFENQKKNKLALNDYENALKINPNLDFILSNKSGVLSKLGQIEQALLEIDKAIKINKNNLDHLMKKAAFYQDIKDYESANQIYDAVIKINPNFSEALSRKSLNELLLERFGEGWKLYDHRWWNIPKLQTSKPELLSLDITNKIILVWPEQGLGDQILYSSLLPELLRSENYFLVSLDARLIDIYNRSFASFSNVKFIPHKKEIGQFAHDFQIPIGSLGKFFRNHLKDFDRQPKGFLKSSTDQANKLKEKLGLMNKKICGISWRSANKQFGYEKSIALNELLPVLSRPDTIFLNLQYGEVEEEIENFSARHNINIINISEIDNFNDIDGLTSLISICDFVVTSSNVTAHIAGALNKLTYLLVPYGYGRIWYWGENRDRSLWYPSINICRCNKSESWDHAIKLLSLKLSEAYD